MRTSRWTALAFGLIGALMVATSAIGYAEGSDGDGEPPNNKCCTPAKATPPGPQSCPEVECMVGPICTPFVKKGTWKAGNCNTPKTGADCQGSVGPLPAPKFQCRAVACTPPQAGKQTCGWVLIGFDDTDMANVSSCNGTPCG
jgi:hypothetical protein